MGREKLIYVIHFMMILFDLVSTGYNALKSEGF